MMRLYETIDALRPGVIASWLSRVGLVLCIVVALLLVCNQYGAIRDLVPYYRINTPALCLVFGFVTAAISMRFAIAACVFTLPLLPTFAWQFQLYTGYGRIQDVTGSGLDLVAGLLLGVVANCLWQKRRLKDQLTMTWPAGLLMVIVTISVAIAIGRNLHQSASPFTFQALLYNLMHLRTLGWHDDYRPLLDWAAYGAAFLLMALLVPALKSMPARNDVIFLPLIAGLVIAALVGWRQSAFGAGLNDSQLNFRLDRFGFMAVGFQPDLHAFAAHMLLGVIGLLGYLYFKRSLSLRVAVVALVIPLCGFVLFLSKSKATFALAVFCLILAGVVWLCRHTKYFKPTLLSICALTALVVLSIPLFADGWAGLLSLIVQKFNLPDLHTLNLKLSYRPEVYLAAFRMFALFPFAGLGQSEFYRQSANHDVTQSLFLSVEQNGENAHNYFLQTLVENGLLGFGAFLVLLLYPLYKASDKRALIPALVALIAVFGGNLFSHSMLVRENLLLAACFVALMYAWVEAQVPSSVSTSVSGSASSSVLQESNQALSSLNVGGGSLSRIFIWLSQPRVLMICFSLAFLFIAKEAYQSLNRIPFNIDIQCIETRRLERDGWTSGRYLLEVPVGTTGLVLNLATTQPDVVKRPLNGSFTLWYDQRVLLTKDFVLNKTGPQSLELDLPEGKTATPDDYQIELKIQRCFVPRNFGMGGDGRRLGIRIESVDWR
jgi:hypothetical protein